MTQALAALAFASVAAAASSGQAQPAGLSGPGDSVCRGTDPKCYNDWPRAKTTQYRVLLFTRTGGPRHAHLGTALPPGMNPPLAANNAVHAGMLRLAKENGFILDYTEDLTQMRRLSGYNAVVFFSTSRETLDDDAKTALRQYMRAGGGFVGIHNAFGTHYNWPYYEGLLGGANFYDHGPNRDGDVLVVSRTDTSTRGLPARFGFRDEWYNLMPSPTNVRILATVDESSWKPEQARQGGGGPPPGVGGPPGGAPRAPQLPSVVGSHPGHPKSHPVAWCQYYDGGKAWLTTLGHDSAAFSTDPAAFPGALEFQKLIVGGIMSAAGMEPFCR